MVPGLHLLGHLVRAGVPLRDVLWFCAGREIEDRALAGAYELLGDAVPFERVVLDLEPPGGGAPSLARIARRTPSQIGVARRALRSHGSRVLIGLGGYTSLPACLAARSLGRPVTLLEINAVAGRATRFSSWMARRIYHAWPSTVPGSGRSRRHVHVGPPVAPAFGGGPPDGAAAAAARAATGFDPERPLLVVLGGSQGALALNRFCQQWAPNLVASGVQVLHQVGPGRKSEGCEAFSGYRRVEYLADVAMALTAATIVLCRGGASTLAEVAALARPALVVPYPHHADRHQERNALALGEGVRIVPEERMSSSFVEELKALCGPDAAPEREAMSHALLAGFPRDGAQRICADLVELATPRRRWFRK